MNVLQVGASTPKPRHPAGADGLSQGSVKLEKSIRNCSIARKVAAVGMRSAGMKKQWESVGRLSGNVEIQTGGVPGLLGDVATLFSLKPAMETADYADGRGFPGVAGQIEIHPLGEVAAAQHHAQLIPSVSSVLSVVFFIAVSRFSDVAVLSGNVGTLFSKVATLFSKVATLFFNVGVLFGNVAGGAKVTKTLPAGTCDALQARARTPLNAALSIRAPFAC